MSRVSWYCDCPRCGAMLRAGLHYGESLEEYVSCEWCGYHRTTTWETDEPVIKEILAYGVVEYEPDWYPEPLQRAVDTEDKLHEFVATNASLKFAICRRYVDGRWIQTNAFTGEEMPITPPFAKGVMAGGMSSPPQADGCGALKADETTLE